MGTFLDDIDLIRPLAESRGFSISPMSIDGVVSVLLTRTLAHVGQKYFGFENVTNAKVFLDREPCIPEYQVRVSYAVDLVATFEVRARSTAEAMTQAVEAASRRCPNWRIKSIEIL